MTEDDFAINWHEDRRCLEIRLSGFWNDLQVARYSAHVETALAAAADRPFDVIGDLSGLIPQPGSVVDLQADLVGRLTQRGMRRFVIVGAGPLLTMQVKRAATGGVVPEFVAEMEAARCLLDSRRP